MPSPALPSLLPSSPAYQDTVTTPQQVEAAHALGKATDPDQTPIFICDLPDCCRLYPTRDRLMAHRKRDHNSDSDADIITWNDN